MMKQLLTLLLLFTTVSSFSQEGLSLFECFQQAWDTHPLMPQKKLYHERAGLESENIKSMDLPILSLKGKASYQSEVTHLEGPQAAMVPEPLAKDQYQTWMDLNQTLYQGNRHSKQQDLTNTQLKANLKQVDTELYHTLNAVNHAFFSTLQIQENIAILQLKTQTLNEQIKELESAVQEGIIIASKLDALRAESLEVEQSLENLYSQKKISQYTLSQLIGSPVTGQLQIPELNNYKLTSDWESRPETQFLEVQQQIMDAQSELVQTTRSPVLYGFGKAGYGLPGLNMLKNEFDPYYLVGVGLSWRITDWKKTSREKQIISLQKQHIETQKINFKRDYEITIQRLKETIETLEKQLKRDTKIINLRQSITSRSAHQLKEGVITSADYIQDLNKEIAARLTQKKHQTELAMGQAQLLIAYGDPHANGLLQPITNTNF